MNEKNIAVNELSLRDYFKHVVANEGISLQFTASRIQELIEKDLEIVLVDSLYKKVCVEAFSYYIQSWPKWNMTVNTSHSDVLYNDLKVYLQMKFNELKQKVCENKNKDVRKNIVNLLDKTLEEVNTVKKGNITLRISVPENLLYNKTPLFKQLSNCNDLLLTFDTVIQSNIDISNSALLNHPFIQLEFDIPGYVHFIRSVPCVQKQFIMDLNVKPDMDQPFIIAVDKSPSFDNTSRIFTYKLMLLLFKELNSSAKTNAMIPHNLRYELLSAAKEFVSDIIEADLCDKTVCEGVSVLYNIGKSTYFVDSLINCDSEPWATDLNLLHRKLLTPVIKYSLISCSVLRHHVDKNGVNYFDFKETTREMHNQYFVQYINSCLKYKCIVCNLYGTLLTLKTHMKEKHSLDALMQCTKCLKNNVMADLLKNRWKHSCLQ